MLEDSRSETVRADLTLEPDGPTMRAWVDAAMRHIVAHVESLPDQPAGYAFEDAHARSAGISDPVLPEEGKPLEDLLEHLFAWAAPESFNTAGPGYLAYIPGGGLFHAALAELVANALNRYVGVWLAAPRLAQIETDVIQWFAALMGLPEGTRGLLTTGGSMANFTAIVTARRRLLGESLEGGRIYAGDQVHHSVAKAAMLAGFPRAAVVRIESDDAFRLPPRELAAALDRDRAAGHRPFLVVASAGTTNTGAVDDLPALAGACREAGVWLHVDAAYGGFFRLTEPGRQRLAGTELADSVTLDPHKGLFMPYGIGALLVRDGVALREAHSIEADYMPAMQHADDGEMRLDFCEHGPELSRGFRGLQVWLPFKLHGAGPFRANLEEKLLLTRHATDVLEGIEGIEIVAPPQLSVVAFRLVMPGLDAAALNALNEELLARILRHQRVWLTSTRLRGVFVIRICVLSFRTHQDRVDDALRIIEEESRSLRSES